MMDMRLKKYVICFGLTCLLLVLAQFLQAQCSICTRTAQQLGEKPAQGLNAGIIYLAFAPLAIVGIIGFRWWQKEKHMDDNEKTFR